MLPSIYFDSTILFFAELKQIEMAARQEDPYHVSDFDSDSDEASLYPQDEIDVVPAILPQPAAYTYKQETYRSAVGDEEPNKDEPGMMETLSSVSYPTQTTFYTASDSYVTEARTIPSHQETTTTTTTTSRPGFIWTQFPFVGQKEI